jgi:tetratricopeptide (TPR) repeat protein
MIDFTGILLPLLVIASLFSGVAATDFRSLFIETISVPGSMKDRGYTPTVFIRMMNDRLLGIEATAKTRTEAQRLRTEDEKGIVAAAVDMLSLTALVRAVQVSSNLIEFKVNGEIVEAGENDYLLRLRIDRYGQKVTRIEVTTPRNDVHGLADSGAERIMRITDPQVFCAAVMQKEAMHLVPSSGAFLFAKTDECVVETLPTAQDDDRLWLLNLQGVVAFVEGRQLDAGRHFRSAIRLNADFAPALLNLGILYAHEGRPKKAIGYFERVFHLTIPADAPQTLAATCTEWADALVDIGQPEEAEAMFRRATEADPRYAEAYLRWARHTKDPAMAANLQALGEEIARRQHGGLYTENLVGRLRTAAAQSRKPGTPGQADDLEGAIGDVGLLAEPGDRDHNLWDYIRNTWRRM